MTIQLKPEHEHVIGQAIQAGLIANADDVVEVGVEAIRQRLQSQVGARLQRILSSGCVSSKPGLVAIPQRLHFWPTRRSVETQFTAHAAYK